MDLVKMVCLASHKCMYVDETEIREEGSSSKKEGLTLSGHDGLIDLKLASFDSIHVVDVLDAHPR